MGFDVRNGGFNLVFDADDTLWDSNIHFHETQAAFLEVLRGAGVDNHVEIRAAMLSHELSIIEEIGYGRGPYLRALHRVVEQLVEPTRRVTLRAAVDEIGHALINCDCELLPGVEATLTELARRHRLLVFHQRSAGRANRQTQAFRPERVF